MKRKERFKNVLLILLIISSLVLTGKVWFTSDIWPEKYTLFSPIRDKFASILSGRRSSADGAVIYPKRIVAFAQAAGDRVNLELDSYYDEYSNIPVYVQDCIAASLENRGAQTLVPVSESDWQLALNTSGFYADYEFCFDSADFAELLGINIPEDIQNSCTTFRRFIVASDTQPTVSLYMSDDEKNMYFKLKTGINKSGFDNFVAAYSSEATAKNRFSYYIGADKPATGDMNELLFNSYLVLREGETNYPPLISSNPLEMHDEIIYNASQQLLNVFSFSPKTVKKHTDAQSNAVYVQNYETIKINLDGTISYTTSQGRNGMKISDSALSEADAIRYSSSLVEKVSSLFDVTGTIRLTKTDSLPNEYILYFDYYSDGMPVFINGTHAVTIRISSNYLSEYTQILRNYEKSPSTVAVSSTYKAADDILDSLTQIESSVVEDIRVGYKDDLTISKKKPEWFLKLRGTDEYKTVQE